MERQKNQQEQILDHLQAGKNITPLEALNSYGCFRLAAVIYKLKKQGYNIESANVKRDGKSFSSYYIDNSRQIMLPFNR